MSNLRIFPATDLHLLQASSVDLQFFADVPGHGWLNLIKSIGGSSIALKYESHPGVVALSFASPSAKLSAIGVGSTLARLVLSWAGAEQNSAPIRATVHGKLNRLFVPRTTLDLESYVDADRSDRVLTVYAEFEDGGQITVADVTAHPYLRYAVTSTSGSPGVDVPSCAEIRSTRNPSTLQRARVRGRGAKCATIEIGRFLVARARPNGPRSRCSRPMRDAATESRRPSHTNR